MVQRYEQMRRLQWYKRGAAYCDIIRAGENNTQRIIDTLTGHWSQEQANEIQDLKFKNSQLQQNIYLANLMNGGCGCGAGVAGGYQ